MGTLHSEDITNALGVLETNVILVVLSFIFARIAYFDDTLRNDLLRTFTMGVFASALICLTDAIIRYYNGGGTDVFFYYEFTKYHRLASHVHGILHHILYYVPDGRLQFGR